jgi:hypothetical protein
MQPLIAGCECSQTGEHADTPLQVGVFDASAAPTAKPWLPPNQTAFHAL